MFTSSPSDLQQASGRDPPKSLGGFGSLRPDDFVGKLVTLLLPLADDHLVTDLRAVLRLIDRTGLLDGIQQKQPGRIAAGAVVLGCKREALAS
jgi:hypothetical protein